MAKGLTCEKCSGETEVIYVKRGVTRIFRYRKCVNCSESGHTIEVTPNKCRNCNIGKIEIYKTIGKEKVIRRKRVCLNCYYRVESNEFWIRTVEPKEVEKKKLF